MKRGHGDQAIGHCALPLQVCFILAPGEDIGYISVNIGHRLRKSRLGEILMQRIAGLTVILLPAALSAQTKDGFVPLFNGMDLDGWEVRESNPGDKEKWSFKNNLLVAKPGGGWIGTKKMYGDFVLKVEWRIFE